MRSRAMWLGLLVAGTAGVAHAAEAPAGGLEAHLPVMIKAAIGLTVAFVILLAWEFLDRRSSHSSFTMASGGSFGASNVSTQPARSDPFAPSPAPAADPFAARTPAAPPPPTPTRSPAPPGDSPSGAEDDNPFRRLSKLGAEDEAAPPLAPPPMAPPPMAPSMPPLSASTAPASLACAAPSPFEPPSAPVPAPGTASGGGWADLLQRVRAGEGSDEEAPRPTRPVPPIVEPDPPPATASAGGWESLLKKTMAEDPSPPAESHIADVEAAPHVPRSIKLGLGGEAGTSGEKPLLDPVKLALDGGGPDSDDHLPDFVKKATRTIALDLKKGGEQAPPPPMPRTEG